MEYVALLKFRQSSTAAERDAALMRRASWNYPSGLKLIGEYWPMGSTVQVVSIFSADEYANIMELVFEWNDIFDIDVFPAVSADEGLKSGPEVFGRLHRLQAS
jgi:hypothetical protein